MPQPDFAPLARALRELSLSFARTSPPSTLSRTAAGTLSVLERCGPRRVTELAEHEAVTQPAMSGLVQRMEAAGLVAREADPADARACLVAVTEEGRETLQARRRQQDAMVAARLAALEPHHLAALESALAAVTALGEQDAPDATRGTHPRRVPPVHEKDQSLS